jgi:hypothetical protein
MSTGVVDVSQLVKDSMAKMTAMGGNDIPENAGVSPEHGPVVTDLAALLQVTSSVGVPGVKLPSETFEKLPTPGV